jgi:hypothetical protein
MSSINKFLTYIFIVYIITVNLFFFVNGYLDEQVAIAIYNSIVGDVYFISTGITISSTIKETNDSLSDNLF